MKSTKAWSIGFLILTFVLLAVVGGITLVVDPYFHYHAPLEMLAYPLDNERYQNDGIVRHFPYDTIITGSSMTENFKTSECDEIFGVTSVKVPFSGASFKEVNDNLTRAFAANPNIQLVIRGLDGNRLTQDKDTMGYEDYPTYLTDDLIWNDVNYILNKQILFEATVKVLRNTQAGKESTTFDEYANWTAGFRFGENAILSNLQRLDPSPDQGSLPENVRETITGNLTQNVIALAREHPETEFFLFFPPYSAYYWDWCCRAGKLDQIVESYRLATQLLLQEENIHVFSFFDEYDMITDPNNYKDLTHYREEINTQILLWMQQGEHELIRSNYEGYWQSILEFYRAYDYDHLYDGE